MNQAALQRVSADMEEEDDVVNTEQEELSLNSDLFLTVFCHCQQILQERLRLFVFSLICVVPFITLTSGCYLCINTCNTGSYCFEEP